jgi:ferredoxin, 2Fe-2S
VPRLTVVTREGSAKTIEANAGLSVMEAIREAGFDELLALCGGCLSCATCHIHVDPLLRNKLPPMSDTESALLEDSGHRDENSRLACQILLSDELDNLRVTIAQ